MSLSDDEQRILRQIEQELQNDSKFAQAVSPSGLYSPVINFKRDGSTESLTGGLVKSSTIFFNLIMIINSIQIYIYSFF